MKKKYLNKMGLIKRLMINSLELPIPSIYKGKPSQTLTGEFVCHEDILGKEIGEGWDDSFSVCADEEHRATYLIAIKIVEE